MPKTLLLADDSVTIQRVIELTFAHEDVRVVSVGDGRRALQWMETERPDIVLVDVEVPEVDGYAVSSHIKNTPRLEQVPVLLLAGAFEPVDDARAKKSGCDGVLIKPFEPKQLVTRVKELLTRGGAVPAGRGDAHHDFSGRSESMGGTVTPFPAIMGRPSDGPIALAMSRAAVGVELEALEPEPLEPPARPVWDEHALGGAPAPAMPSMPRPVEAPPPPAKVSLVSAFSALLAAEQSRQPQHSPIAAPAQLPPTPALTEANVEDAVRRVLTRMTDELVRRIVVETAERMIKEEIRKIKEGFEE